MRVYCVCCLGVFSTDRNDNYYICGKYFDHLNQMINNLAKDMFQSPEVPNFKLKFKKHNGKY